MSAAKKPPATFTCECGQRHKVGVLTGLPAPSKMVLAGFIHPDGGYSNSCRACGKRHSNVAIRARGRK